MPRLSAIHRALGFFTTPNFAPKIWNGVRRRPSNTSIPPSTARAVCMFVGINLSMSNGGAEQPANPTAGSHPGAFPPARVSTQLRIRRPAHLWFSSPEELNKQAHLARRRHMDRTGVLMRSQRAHHEHPVVVPQV